MDAGLAAVLGALAGSVATIGAALATGWAQREGARITARAEHRRERREPRQSVYKVLISEASQLRDSSAPFAVHPDLYPVFEEEPEARWRQLVTAIKEASTDAALAGPPEVSEAAISLSRGASALLAELCVYNIVDEDGQRDARVRLFLQSQEFDSSVTVFIIAAQAALDDDGSRK
ncbi:hypothetical protein [Streptomyces chartreusis]|uniref:hypothetical protein n=1 Tax=Streptomyces chartreusis TaxID=1969 RepID=UPI00123D1536|nr:hypothetical protein [Streptomyces chartreusis]GGX12675.1 hypothetical protein GCM10010321_28970 [Streptomyces chartreusis]